ncbi:unnamed protein product [Paramecium primaurelia]|uniref:Uncharacterized protein n=1 Tax=Paramecium primaurelia TaxID=5886 RepID=A0A8S1KM06_PARPR|nr:unnamed protein product [Paramecium primaurelia]
MSLDNVELVFDNSDYRQINWQIHDHYSDEDSRNQFDYASTNNTSVKQQKSFLIEKASPYDSPIDWNQYHIYSLSPTNLSTQFEVKEQDQSWQPGSTLYCSCQQEPHCLSCCRKSISNQLIQKKITKHIKKNGYFSIRKNFPKLIGRHLLKQIEQSLGCNIPKGIQLFLDYAMKRKQAKLQQSFAIEDFRRICLNSEESKEYFIDFILNKFIVHLMHSSKFTQIDLVLDLIRNAYVGACNPEQWKGNMQIYQA